MITKHLERKAVTDPRDDALYWRSRPPQERIAALEVLRAKYNAWKYGNAKPGFQRVYKRTERA